MKLKLECIHVFIEKKTYRDPIEYNFILVDEKDRPFRINSDFDLFQLGKKYKLSIEELGPSPATCGAAQDDSGCFFILIFPKRCLALGVYLAVLTELRGLLVCGVRDRLGGGW